jgi:2-keto-4-pentenoate hydratase/2-oxohepta-3-ene-1,7-dioic acid hydratase in catechol pathway
MSFAPRGEQPGTPRYGAVQGQGQAQEVVDLAARIGDRHPTLLALLRDGALAEAEQALSRPGPRLPLDAVEWLPPIPEARRIFCVGTNYPKEHPLGGQVTGPSHPSVFQKAAESLVPHRGRLQRPTASEQFDYEGELALVIGRAGHRIPAGAALSHVAGYSCLNDGSVRDFQKHSVWAGKNFVRSGGFGPWIVTADEIPDPAALTLVTRLNGEEVQRTGTGRMFFGVPEIVAYISSVTPLLPGDVIATGSPEGSGATRSPPRWLRSGDRIEVEVTGIGTLENRLE